MKRIILIICIAFTSNSIFSQSAVGIKLGVNYAHMKFSNKEYTTSAVLAEHFGAFYTHSLTSKVSLQAELVFSAEGNNQSIDDFSGTIDETLLRIPVLAQYNLTDGLYVEAGPQYSLILSIKETSDEDPTENIRNNFKSGTFGYAFGAGYRFKKKLSGFMTGIRYNGDLSRLNKVDVNGGDIKNSLLQLSFMYAFPMKKGK